MSWDLKYRPRRFSEVLGNAGVVRLLLIRSRSGGLAERSMMFGGPKGCGKTSLARIVAKAIACPELEDGEPCCECAVCRSVDEGVSESFEEFDAATQGTVDHIRAIVHDLEFGTMDGRPRVVVIDEAHRLSKQSQDALLSPMEDRRVVVILCTTEPHSIRGAIRDRAEEYPVSPAPMDEIVVRMGEIVGKEGGVADPSALALIARLNRQNPRTSITSLEMLSALGPVTEAVVREVYRYDSLEDVVRALCALDSAPAEAFSVLDGLFSRESPTWVRDNIVAAVASAVRESVGARPTYPVPTPFFASRGRGWAALGSALSRIDRPDAAAVEAVLLEAVPEAPPLRPQPALPVPSSAAAVDGFEVPCNVHLKDVVIGGEVNGPARLEEVRTAPPSVRPAEPRKPDPERKSRSVEHDGVKFTQEETLTSLDKKVVGATAPPRADGPTVDSPVVFDHRLAPMPAREFARAFKKGNQA